MERIMAHGYANNDLKNTALRTYMTTTVSYRVSGGYVAYRLADYSDIFLRLYFCKWLGVLSPPTPPIIIQAGFAPPTRLLRSSITRFQIPFTEWIYCNRSNTTAKYSQSESEESHV